jgi:hypothetical protein
VTASAALAEHVNALVDGFRERREFFVDHVNHTPACRKRRAQLAPGERRHHTCACPRSREARAESQKQPALLAQLHKVQALARTGEQTGGGRPKPGSKPPRSLAAVSLLDDIRTEANEAAAALADLCGEPVGPPKPVADQLRHLVTLAARAETDYPDEVGSVVWAVGILVKRARRLLGYDRDGRMRPLRDTVCPECEGVLLVREDASSDVVCSGRDDQPGCGTRYPRWTWLSLLEGSTE